MLEYRFGWRVMQEHRSILVHPCSQSLAADTRANVSRGYGRGGRSVIDSPSCTTKRTSDEEFLGRFAWRKLELVAPGETNKRFPICWEGTLLVPKPKGM
jgi:hypothetical protein